MNFDIGDADGETPLFYSISSKQFEITKYLVSRGAKTDHKSRKRGWNPIYVAATLGTIECLEYLVDLGCDVNMPTTIRRTALTKTCWMGLADSLKVLLKHPKIDLEWKANSERTALQHAVWGPCGGKDGKKHGTNPKDSPECALLLL
jgi:exosome complex exonuclease RRP6